MHRVIWKLVTGRDPVADIDHKDRNRKNNRWRNLREATRTQNCINAKLRPKNVSGVAGVAFNKLEGKWKARMAIGKRRICLGTFARMEDAVRARLVAERKIYRAFARTA